MCEERLPHSLTYNGSVCWGGGGGSVCEERLPHSLTYNCSVCWGGGVLCVL